MAGIELANWNWKVVHQFVLERFGVGLSRSGCLNYLHRLGFAFKRPKKRLVKADERKRESFVAEYAALTEEARRSGARIFFADEAHFRADAELRGKWVLRACLRSLQYVKLRLLPEGVIMSHSYSSDISREQFARILPCLESARRRTKPRTVDLYDVFCGVLYLLKSGCQWRMLPADFPDWRTCYKYFRQWSERPDPAKYSILEQVLKKIG